MIRNIGLIFLLVFGFSNAKAQDKNPKAQGNKYKVQTIAFYNTENFYDSINDPRTNDDEWVYTGKNYYKKINNIAKVISLIGTKENPNSPVVIGLAEIENRGVLEDLVKNPQIADKNYGIIHFDSPDRRGIDNALLYQKKHFKPTSYKNIPLYIYDKEAAAAKAQVAAKADKDKKEEKPAEIDDDDKGVVINVDRSGRIYTRDQLLVTGLLDGEEISFIVNHWPSRRGGEAISSSLREAAAALNVKIIDSLYAINPNAKIITMGDLNDGPYNRSIKVVLGAKAHKDEVKQGGLFNPMEEMAKKGMGTLAYRDAWDIFDQMIMTEPLVRTDYSSYRYWKAGVYNATFMIQKTGPYKGYGLRNSNGEMGYSDHFPVYIYLIKEQK